MIQFNALEYNGVKTSDFSFKVYVEVNDGINIPQRKTKIITTDQMHGALIKSSDNYSTIEKKYKFYVQGATLQEMAPLFKWLNSSINDNGFSLSNHHTNYLKPYDNPGRYYNVLKVIVGNAYVDEFDGYEFDVTFTCQPFSYSDGSLDDTQLTVVFPEMRTITNTSGIHMYPQLEIETINHNDSLVTIGEQTIHIVAPDNYLAIECFPGQQNVSDKNGLRNECMIGEFFKIPPGEHGISATDNISKITINCRWGDLT
ncbi:phage tail protein [Staphylococcus epidermidis]|uniref:tail protein n=1 Tax=Staphylococcus epidermidis TaxID=1282 RepID=UPI0005091627|nr:tail protein [Staphylococcus epidermidis]AIR82939.1 phage tail family protein [Staphylococcus epidermidis]MBF2170650.1 phage tail protein [Staphylococcus epidermidis]